MLTKLGVVVALVMLAVAAVASSGQTALAESPPPSGPAKILILNPTSGVVGTVVTGELFNAPPNDFITVIFKIPGDPVLTTGTSDANGYLKVTFTIPYVPGGGTYPVFFTDFKCSCQIATDFTVINSRPTPTPTATPTTPPSATPTRTPTTPPTIAATATPTSTPGVPVLGTTGPGGGPGPNFGVLGLGFLAVLMVLAWFAATRKQGPAEAALAFARIDDSEPDAYSTELDFDTLDSFRRTRPAAATRRLASGSGTGWAIGAGLAAFVGVVLLRKRP